MIIKEDISRGYYISQSGTPVYLYQIVAEPIEDEWCLHWTAKDTGNHDFVREDGCLGDIKMFASRKQAYDHVCTAMQWGYCEKAK